MMRAQFFVFSVLLSACVGDVTMDNPDSGNGLNRLPDAGAPDGTPSTVDAAAFPDAAFAVDALASADAAPSSDAMVDAGPPPGFPGTYEVRLCEAPCAEGVGYVCGPLGCCPGFSGAMAQDALVEMVIPALPGQAIGYSGPNFANGGQAQTNASTPGNNQLTMPPGWYWSGLYKRFDPWFLTQLPNGDLVPLEPLVLYGFSPPATRICEIEFTDPRILWVEVEE